MTLLRWLLLLPAAVLAWYAVFALGLYTHGLAERHLCPPADLVSGWCFNAGVQRTLDFLMHGFVALSAVAVGVALVVVAPARREQVLLVALPAGILVALLLALAAQAWSLWAAAAVGGTLGFRLLRAWLRRRGAVEGG